MAPSRRHDRPRQSSLSLALAGQHAAADRRPPLSALFLIDFDVKAGYTLVWGRARPGLELDGRVEYKSLPSGLHTVRDDLVYFVHDGAHAGLSAFVNEPCDEEAARNARMIAVGVLVPLSYGRLGRAWRHAENLKDMAATLAKDRSRTDVLQKYWDANKAGDEDQDTLAAHAANLPPSPTQDRKTHSRKRSASDGAALLPAEHKLSPYHPAWSLAKLLDRFGPLIFPIHRAALLRKRILISCHAPVHEICDFVYDISILSNIPSSVSDALPPSAPTPRLRPLFTIGVHDIPFLMEDYAASKRRGESGDEPEDEAGSGWIACTTDSILAVKDTLWDMLITMPPDHLASANDKLWPTVECPRGSPIMATQRDLRRFNALRSGLARLAASTPGAAAPETPEPETSGARASISQSHLPIKDEPVEGVDQLVEPPTWASLAYNGYMWWASAGEQLRSEEQEESSRDAALLADLAPAPHTPMSMPRLSTGSEPLADSVSSFAGRRAADADEARVELAIIAYFHRLTSQMLSVVVDVVDSAEEAYPQYRDDDHDDAGEDEAETLLSNGVGENDDEDGGNDVTIDSHCLENMGLDVWSASDAAFVQDLVAAYFGRAARIEGKGVEVCGVRVC